jgi:hypothetical protein
MATAVAAGAKVNGFMFYSGMGNFITGVRVERFINAPSPGGTPPGDSLLPPGEPPRLGDSSLTQPLPSWRWAVRRLRPPSGTARQLGPLLKFLPPLARPAQVAPS